MNKNVIVVQFDTYDDAQKAINWLRDITIEHGSATISDLYDFCDLPNCYEDSKRGWGSVDGYEITHNVERNVYLLRMPPYEDLNTPSQASCEKKLNKILAKHEPDMVNHPAHYKSESGLEVIDVIEAFVHDLQGIEAADTANVIKYICRWKHKNGIEDLKKARWYLDHLINHIEKENNHE